MRVDRYSKDDLVAKGGASVRIRARQTMTELTWPDGGDGVHWDVAEVDGRTGAITPKALPHE